MRCSEAKANARCLVLGRFIAVTGVTVRVAAETFQVSKSTVFNYVSRRLWRLDSALAAQVADIMVDNKQARGIRGAEATKKHWERRKVSNG